MTQRLRYLLSVLLLGCLGSVPALPSAREVVSHPSIGQSPAWAVADLDGDSLPDLITATNKGHSSGRYQHRIEVKLNGVETVHHWSIGFFQAGVSISPRDIDRDGDLDLIFENALWRTSFSVWVNNGSGRFRQLQPELIDVSLIWEEPAVSPLRSAKPMPPADGRRFSSHPGPADSATVHFHPDSLVAGFFDNLRPFQSVLTHGARAPPKILS